jgi:hypothetical protein
VLTGAKLALALGRGDLSKATSKRLFGAPSPSACGVIVVRKAVLEGTAAFAPASFVCGGYNVNSVENNPDNDAVMTMFALGGTYEALLDAQYGPRTAAQSPSPPHSAH